MASPAANSSPGTERWAEQRRYAVTFLTLRERQGRFLTSLQKRNFTLRVTPRWDVSLQRNHNGALRDPVFLGEAGVCQPQGPRRGGGGGAASVSEAWMHSVSADWHPKASSVGPGRPTTSTRMEHGPGHWRQDIRELHAQVHCSKNSHQLLCAPLEGYSRSSDDNARPKLTQSGRQRVGLALTTSSHRPALSEMLPHGA